MTLDQLSAAFTRLEGWPSALRETGLNNVGPLASDIATIMEAYRTGRLVAVADGAIERVAEARDKALDEAAGELERLDGFGEWHEAAQAIRALKSPKPPIL